MPCLTRRAGDGRRADRDGRRPIRRSIVAIDIAADAVTAGGRQLPDDAAPAAREAFLDGSWDATGLLLDSFEEVEAVAARLPYVSGRWS